MRRLSRWLLSRPLFRAPVRRTSSSNSARIQPRVEPLEDRVVPAGGMGRPLPFPVIFAGGGFASDSRVNVIDADTGAVNFTVTPYESQFTGGVNVAAADLNADGFPDLITGPGINGGPRVRSFDGKTGEALDIPLGNFWAFEENYTGGVTVAAGDVTGDGVADIVVAAAWGGGPRVRAFDGATGEAVADFWAFEQSFTGGVNVAVADLNLDNRAEIIVGAGAGGGSRVVAFDLKSGEPAVARGFHTNFMADGSEARDGAVVSVADVNGDRVPDVIAAPATGGAPRVKIFNGFDGSTMSDFLAFDAGETGGVRVSSFYLTEDGYADVVVASATGDVRVFNAGTGQLVAGPVADFAPFEAATGRLNIAAANDPGTSKVTLDTTISSLSGTLASGQGFGVTMTAIPFSKAAVPTGTVTLYIQEIAPGTGNVIPIASGTLAATGVGFQSAAKIAVKEHGLEPGTYQVYGTYGGDATFNVPFNTEIAIIEIGVSQPAPLPVCECSETEASVQHSPAGSSLGAPSNISGGVRVADGGIALARQDFDSASLGGSGFAQSWGWTNMPGYADAEAGSGGGLSQSPNLVQVSGDGSIAAITGTNSALFFDYYFGEYHARFNDQTTLTQAGGQFTLVDGSQNTWVFYDFSGGTPSGRAGRMISSTSSDGTATTVTSWDGSGRPTEYQRVTGAGGSAVTESLVNTYVASGANAGLIETATLRRKVGSGSWSTVRTAEYTYYVNADNHGQDKHLKLAVVKDGSSNVLSTDYYRYDVSAGPTDKPLRFAFGPVAYARLVNDLGSSVDSLSDSQVDDYADHYLEYDSSTKRITKHVAAGAGCSICSGGQGEYTYSYATNVVSGVTIQGGTNVWRQKVTETLPDGNQNIYYLNGTGQVMLRIYKDTTTNALWRWYTRYDDAGRAIYSAGPSNVTSHDEQYADLVNDQGGNYQYLDDDDGLVTVREYSGGTSATTTLTGSARGYLDAVAIRQGEMGTDISQSVSRYILRTVGGEDYVFPATETQYRNDNGTGGQTTSWDYTWFSGTAEVESVTTTLPTVTTGQNGPNSAATMTTFNDAFGRPIWSKDADGFLSFTEYDTKTGAVVKTIADVEDANTGDFTGLPGGWTTPATGGLHLITTYEVDHLGRVTKATMPNGRVDYTVYDDDNFEVRYYPGWISGSNVPTGPITVSRDDRTNGYTETLTMSATPSVSGNRPTGTESIASVESLSRSYRNKVGQVTHTDVYFDLTGVTYSTAANIGSLNTNYYRSTTDYGKQGGMPNRQVSAAGTITRTEYDGQGRAISMWVGTDDTPTTGSWATTNLTGTNMTKIVEYEYDGGGIGDGNLTNVIQTPSGSGGAKRETENYFDWRNRLVATKSGVEGSESTSVNRPIQYVEYDNLGQAVSVRMYDGDNVSISYTNDVPDAPSSSLLRAMSTASYDELGRAYLTEIYSVNGSSIGSYTLRTNTWFDKRGQVIKTSAPGGLVQKVAYDGVGRVTANYATDGGGDSGWSDADDVAGDIVLSQDEMAYDPSGLVLVASHRDRFHDATDTGALGNPASTSGTAKARVSYMGYYYDAGDRTTASVDVGTNGGSAWSRPGSVPSRSDSVLVSSVTYDSAGMTYETTDPRAIVSRTLYDDLGRTTKTIEHYVDGTVGDDNDKTTEYAYGPAGMTSLTAKLTGGGVQTTEWVYGVTTGGGSGINSNDAVGATKWPDPSSGASSSGEQETVTVNALGQPLVMTDRNGTVHTLTYDVLGRVTVDTVTTVGSGVDGTVRRIETAYDEQGNAYLFTSYDATTSGNIVTQVRRKFNDLGQLAEELQSHSGAVNTMTTPSVNYDYSEMPSGANHSRLTSITYPDGYVLTYNYASGLNGDISRLSSLSDSGGTLESYDYLGLGTVVRRSHPQPDLDLTFLGTGPGSGGDQYVGLDSFGRVIDHHWKTTGGTTDSFAYTYDRNSNRLTKDNAVNSYFDEAYTYDSLNQLTGFDRNSGDRTQAWDFDALGNWDSLTTDGGSPQTRTHNKQNEITAVSGATSPTFDANGNMTTDETGKQYVYDAWNRLKVVKDSGGTTLKTYVYDALNRRVAETAGGATTDFYYSASWQVLEERDAARTNDTKARYVWSPVYVDAMILRDRDTADDGTLEERLWVQQDANFNVTALVDDNGDVVERYVYDPFGVATVLDETWSVIGSSAYGWLHLHQGGRLDATSGLYHFRHRDYSPVLGRWATRDPAGYSAGDAVLYRYGNANPNGNLDPLGLAAFKFDENKCELTMVQKAYIKLNGFGNIPPIASAMIQAFLRQRIESVWNQGTFSLKSVGGMEVYNDIKGGINLNTRFRKCLCPVTCTCIKPLVKVDFVTNPKQADFQIEVNFGRSPKSSGTGGEGGVSSNGKITIWLNDESDGNILAHEFGHIIGLPHPGTKAGTIFPWHFNKDPDYDADPKSLMGRLDSSLRGWYFEAWKTAMQNYKIYTNDKDGKPVSYKYCKYEIQKTSCANGLPK